MRRFYLAALLAVLLAVTPARAQNPPAPDPPPVADAIDLWGFLHNLDALAAPATATADVWWQIELRDLAEVKVFCEESQLDPFGLPTGNVALTTWYHQTHGPGAHGGFLRRDVAPFAANDGVYIPGFRSGNYYWIRVHAQAIDFATDQIDAWETITLRIDSPWPL